MALPETPPIRTLRARHREMKVVRRFDEPARLNENRKVGIVGLWRSWERASMAWKRSSVRSRSGPPINQQLASSLLSRLVSFGVKFRNTFIDTAPRLSIFPPKSPAADSGFTAF
jgi:hypothetical protein